ncbi:MAG: sigma-70 family RNA polymerase sigma factor [Deltaproteobacteria bacterium]|nr:sigma-70 family RNA polymerase sigma factor [Deltaproteobacteria bacterium]
MEGFFRHEAGRLVATLGRRYGSHGIELVEDAVQNALERALGTWSRRGVPENPAAWLTRVATHQVIDRLRRAGREVELDDREVASDDGVSRPCVDALGVPDEIALLFACADETLPERARLVLCLKLVCGFSTREIATRLFTSDANVQKMLERGRLRLREAWSEGGLPPLARDDLERRLAVVQQVLYLQFNEGYASCRESEPLRPDLCDDAIRLCQLLLANEALARPSTWALLALMHFHRGRLGARLDGSGGILLLHEQDRSRWDKHQFALALECLASAASESELSKYHGEALILAEHCLAPSYAETRWSEIVDLYELLERLSPSPYYVLQRAIALAEWRGPEHGLDLLRREHPPSWLAGHYLWRATMGELLRRTSDFAGAVVHLRAALEITPTRAERAVFERYLERATAGDATGPERPP